MSASRLDRLLEADLLPDAVLRLGIRRLCRRARARRRRPAASRRSSGGSTRGSRPCATARSRSRRARPTSSTTRCPPASSSCVLGRRLKYSCGYWPRGRRRPRRGRGGDARADLRARGPARRPAHPRARLRLGLAHAVDGRALSARAASRPSRTRAASGVHRGARPPRRGLAQRRGGHRRHERLRHARRASTAWSRSRCSSTCATTRRCSRAIAAWLRAGRAALRPHLHPPRAAYPYEDRGAGDWMARHFFTGGQMPSHDLLLHFQRDLRVVDHWARPGHALRAHRRGLARQPGPARREVAARAARDLRRRRRRRRWRVRWRVFFMACAELWAFRGGEEWLVTTCCSRSAERRPGQLGKREGVTSLRSPPPGAAGQAAALPDDAVGIRTCSSAVRRPRWRRSRRGSTSGTSGRTAA